MIMEEKWEYATSQTQVTVIRLTKCLLDLRMRKFLKNQTCKQLMSQAFKKTHLDKLDGNRTKNAFNPKRGQN